MGRGRSRGRPRGPEEAAPHSQADLRQARRRARLRRLLLHRAEVRPRAQARPGGGGRRGVPRARVGARHLPGRFRELPRRGRREDPRPQAAGRDASALERPAVRRPHVAEVGVPVRRAARDLPPLGPRPGGDGARQRHRGGQDGTRRGHGIEAVLAVQSPLPLREPVLQPLFGKREGLRRERRGVPPAQPPRPRACVRRAPRAQRVPRRGVREGQRGGALPRRQAARGGLPGGPRRHARPSRRGVRRGEVGHRPRRQARLRRGRRARVRRRARLARAEPARRHARVDGGDPRRPRPPGRRPPQGLRGGPRGPEPPLARARHHRQAEGLRGVDDQARHAAGARRGDRPDGLRRQEAHAQVDRPGERVLGFRGGMRGGAQGRRGRPRPRRRTRSTCWRDASREAAAGPAGPTCRSTTGS